MNWSALPKINCKDHERDACDISLLGVHNNKNPKTDYLNRNLLSQRS
jgi:hypothetical protein